MFFFYNSVGLFWVILAFGIALSLQSTGVIIDKEGNYFLEVMSFSISFFDIVARLFLKKWIAEQVDVTKDIKSFILNHWLSDPDIGGSLMFLPAWTTSIFAYLFLTFVVFT